MMRKGHRSFSDEFKIEAVRRAMEPGASMIRVAEELDVGVGILGRWSRDERYGGTNRTRMRRIDSGALAAELPERVKTEPAKPTKAEPPPELARLREQLAKVTKERDHLKKTLAHYLTEGDE
jgi:transposase-like protein